MRFTVPDDEDDSIHQKQVPYYSGPTEFLFQSFKILLNNKFVHAYTNGIYAVELNFGLVIYYQYYLKQ
jgi:hypothetical protein